MDPISFFNDSAVVKIRRLVNLQAQKKDEVFFHGSINVTLQSNVLLRRNYRLEKLAAIFHGSNTLKTCRPTSRLQFSGLRITKIYQHNYSRRES